MKVAVLHGPRNLRLEERQVPGLKAGDILVKVLSAGICGTDLHFRHLGSRFPDQHIPLGHEFAETVIEAEKIK